MTFEVLSLIVALFGVCLVESSPVGPVVDVAARMVWMGSVAQSRLISLQDSGISCSLSLANILTCAGDLFITYDDF